MKWAFQILLGGSMVFAGGMHFILPKRYDRVVPKELPAPRALVYITLSRRRSAWRLGA